MKNAFVYSFKAWLTTLLIAPLIGFAIKKYYGACKHCDYSEYYWAFIGELMVYLFLLPLILLSVVLISKKNSTKRSDKFRIILSGVALTVCYASIVEVFLIYLSHALVSKLYAFEIIIAYASTMGLALWFYNLKPVNENKSTI